MTRAVVGRLLVVQQVLYFNMEYGTKQKYQIGNIKIDKKIYMPSLERFNKWLEIVETKEWFEKVQFYITGSFTNHIRGIKPAWPTWDIDIILTQEEGQMDYQLIKKILLECLGIALIKCSFYLDITYQRKKDIWGIKDGETLNDDSEHIVKAIKYSNKGKIELIKDLWEIHREFPLKKHRARNKFGYRNGEVVSLSEYREKYYNKKVHI